MPENIRSEALWGVTKKLKADYPAEEHHLDEWERGFRAGVHEAIKRVEAVLTDDAADSVRTYTLYWLGGDKQKVSGINIASAMNNAGIGAGALSALDFYSSDDDYVWDDEKGWTKSDD